MCLKLQEDVPQRLELIHENGESLRLPGPAVLVTNWGFCLCKIDLSSLRVDKVASCCSLYCEGMAEDLETGPDSHVPQCLKC